MGFFMDSPRDLAMFKSGLKPLSHAAGSSALYLNILEDFIPYMVQAVLGIIQGVNSISDSGIESLRRHLNVGYRLQPRGE